MRLAFVAIVVLLVNPLLAIGQDSAGEVFRLPTVEEFPAEEFPEELPITESVTKSARSTGDGSFAKLPGDVVVGDSSWFGVDYWKPWEGNVELGLSGTDGNSETFNVRVGALAKYKTEFLERALQITSIQKRANGVTTANTALVDGRLDWPMPGTKWNYFMHSLVEYDEFKAFNCRVSGDTGFGYEFIQNDLTKLIGRSGLSGSQEFGGPDDKYNPELLFGAEFNHQINETNKLSVKIDYYPNVTSFGDFRLNSQASWELILAKDLGLSLKFSLIDRYDSTPHGARPNDLDYSTLLIWAF